MRTCDNGDNAAGVWPNTFGRSAQSFLAPLRGGRHVALVAVIPEASRL